MRCGFSLFKDNTKIFTCTALSEYELFWYTTWYYMTQKYYPTIGLEIHAELATESKMFCSCKNNPDEEHPNVNICPVCMAHPGALPTFNKKAIESMIKIGMAVGGNVADFTEFDRKNYFYPDIPKGYQITQYKFPIVSGGELAGVELTRIHLEEDTGTSKHDAGAGSLIDYNRAGVPLMELVTEPVIHDPETAMRFAKELQLLLRTLGVGHANMEKGEMRVEANISISPDPNVFGTKVEVKNLNSFSVVGKAIAYEIKRMTALHEAGRADEIVQETRGWNDIKGETFSQRTKESAHDYRYFPDPDLPKLHLHSLFSLEEIKGTLPELPWEKRNRYVSEYGIKPEDIESYVTDITLGAYFEKVVSLFSKKDAGLIILASNYITSDLIGLQKSNPEFVFPTHELFAELITLANDGLLSSRAVKDILPILASENRSPKDIAEERGLIQKNDPEALKKIAEEIIDKNPAVVDQICSGKESAIMSLVGQMMKATNGSANPKLAQDILREIIMK
jgi:aspartyl-tRNA(Asn)/glutamyl-tRNA(Gln) amidotransferase subunit B